MKCFKYLLSIILFVLSIQLKAQEIVVSEYYNSTTAEVEWTELLVVKDNINLVGYRIFDCNTNETQLQGGFQFRDIPLWRNLRAGTIIVINHYPSLTATPNIIDTNASDGFIQVDGKTLASGGTYFFDIVSEGGTLVSGFMSYNQNEDFAAIRRPDSTDVHCLSHGTTRGPAWYEIKGPRVHVDTVVGVSGTSLGVVGRTISAYTAGVQISDSATVLSTYSPSSGLISNTKGLPNALKRSLQVAGVKSRNHLFWRDTREPQWTASNPTVTLASQTPTSNTIQFTALSDPFPQDTTTGYLILRDTVNFTQFPANSIRDGAQYAVGQRLGTALIVAQLPTKSITNSQYTDSYNVVCGGSYAYRVYGYRYAADNIMSLAETADTTARGRQYTENLYGQSITFTKPNPAKPLITATKTQICPGDTASIICNVANVQYSWTRNGAPVTIPGGQTLVISEPGSYRVSISAEGGCSAVSDVITITSLPSTVIDVTPSAAQTICAGSSVQFRALSTASSFEWLRNGSPIPGATSATYNATQAGDYQVRTNSTSGCPAASNVLRVRVNDIQYRIAQTTADFGSIGGCTTDTTISVTLQNTGTEAIVISSVTLPTSFALASPPAGFTVAPGQSQQVRLTFSPANIGVSSGTVRFNAIPCNVQVQLPVTGRKTSSSASLNTALVDFGVDTLCANFATVDSSAFEIINNGTDTLSIRVPQVNPPFFLSGDVQFPLRIAPGDRTNITVFYSPSVPELNKSFIEQIRFPFVSTSCNDTLRATIQAATYKPTVTASPTIIDVGGILVCAAQRDTVITITNPTTIDAKINGNFDNTELRLADPNVIIPAGTSVEVQVIITPSATSGTFGISDTIFIAPCNTQIPVTITGSIVAPKPQFAQPNALFDVVHLCEASPSRNMDLAINIPDANGAQLRIQSIAFSKSPTVFTTTAGVGQTIVDGSTIPVNFTPVALGAYTDTLTIVTEPCSETFKVVLSGQATQLTRTTVMSNTDFGILAPAQQSTQTLTITNTSQESLNIEAIDGIRAPFTLVSATPPLPTTLLPGSTCTVVIAVEFPDFEQADSITIESRTSGVCSDTVSFTLRASSAAKGSVVGVKLNVPDAVVVKAGDEFITPIACTSPEPLSRAGILQFTARVRYDGSMLKAVAVPPLTNGITGTVVEQEPGVALLTLSSATPMQEAEAFAQLRFRSYVGGARTTPVSIDSVTATNAVIAGDTGTVTVTTDCSMLAQTIVLGQNAGIGLRSRSSNSVEFEFTSITNDPITIDVFELNGAHVVSPLQQQLPTGVYAITVNTVSFATGVYAVRYSHGIQTQTILISIYK